MTLGERPDVEAMLAAGESFARTGRALAALAAGDWSAYAVALTDIVADFAARDQHLSGVAIADTALVLERLAEPRGMAAHPPGRLPAVSGDTPPRSGAIAQLGERHAGSVEVVGSSPTSSIVFVSRPRGPRVPPCYFKQPRVRDSDVRAFRPPVRVCLRRVIGFVDTMRYYFEPVVYGVVAGVLAP